MWYKLIISSFIATIASLLLLNIAFATTGGPDTFGYTYADSNSGATYSWVSHTGAATTITGRSDDTLHGPYEMGFTFNFYGNDYTQFYVCNNGFVTFVSGNCGYTNVDITNAAVPNNYIGAFWDDLFTGGTIKYELFGSTPNQYMVISFEGINHVSYSAGAITFQIILFETSNNINIQYGDVILGTISLDSGLSATIGIENSDGTDGLKYSYNTASLSDSFAIEYSWPTPSFSQTQSAYRVFANTDTTDVGTAMAAQDTATTLSSPNQEFRVRMLLHVAGEALSQSAGSYKLQYVGKGGGSCASPSGGTPATWTDITTATVIAYKDNTTPTDASALTSNGADPTHSTDTIVNQTYEEANNFSNTQSTIGIGQDGKWDFSLYDKTGTSGTTYCIRIVESDGTALDTYTVYPEITTAITSGGPDTYGYYWNDSNGAGEAYSWNDISGTGTLLTGRADDGMSGALAIGFTFNFYGNNYTQVYICNNGFVSFSADSCAYQNATITTAGAPDNFIAPFWDDLFTGGSIYYQTIGSTPNQKFIVSFDGVNPYSTQGNTLSFQVILHETTNRIKLQYSDVDSGTAGYGGGLGATVGIENSSGTDGLLYSFNANSLSDGYAIDFATESATAPYEQSGYRFFNNNDSTDVGSALATLNTSATLIADGDAFRLRMLLHNDDTELGISGENFKLQFVDRGVGTCAVPSSGTPATWTDVDTTTSIAYKDNTTPSDNSSLTVNANDPTHNADTIVAQSYEELNNFSNSVAAIANGADGLWDFALYDKTALASTNFCFRAVISDDTQLTTYTQYPQITTAASPASLTFSLSGNSISLGALTSTATTSGSKITVGVETTATSGFEVYALSEGNGISAGLYSSAVNELIPTLASSSIVTSGTPSFGIFVDNATAGITIDEGFDNDTVSDLAVSTSFQRIFSRGTATSSEETADINYKTVVDAQTIAGSYSDRVEIMVIGIF